MRHQKILIFLIILSVAISTLAYSPIEELVCIKDGVEDRGCMTSVINLAEPTLWSFLALLFVTLIIVSTRREAFATWAKFAVVGFPLMLGTLLYTYNNEERFGAGFYDWGSDDQFASVILPFLFVLISLGIIVYTMRRKKRR